MTHPFTEQNIRKGSNNYFQIEKKRSPLQVFYLQFNFSFNGYIIPSIDLCPSRDPGF